jgi:hypothetical protein
MKRTDRVLKYWQYIKENSIETPEQNIKIALEKLKNKLEDLFTGYEVKEDGKIAKFGDVKGSSKNSSFVELGMQMNDIEQTKNSVRLKFSDQDFLDRDFAEQME